MRSKLLFLSLLLAIALFAVCSASSPSHRPQVLKRTAPPHGGRCDPAGIPGPAYPGCRASYTVGVTSALEARHPPRASARSARRATTPAASRTTNRGSAPARAPSRPDQPSPPRHDGYHGSVAALIRSTFGSASGCALAIAWRESRFDPYARNPHSSASGVFQLVRLWWDGRWHFNPFNAWLNVHYAHEMYLSYGFGPWGGC